MISLIIFVALLGLVYWVCLTLGVPQPFLRIILVILVVIAVFAVIQAFGYGGSLPRLK